MQKRGNLFIISAASGTGKTSLVKSLLEMMPNLYVSISHTTRPKRAYETDGIHYHFLEKDEFESLIKTNQFLEYATVFDNYYGTSKIWVEQQLHEGKDIILEIDWQGAQQVKKLIRDTIKIFILPPSYEALKSRLIGRGDDDEVISHRMDSARNELVHYNEYDFVVINDDFEQALKELKSIVEIMKHGYNQQQEFFDGFLDKLLNNK
ncbi:MAG: guanylate kinase [Gammaproteobacteria bacterium]|nr:guanylate kinase [Gammaproteobacteria bacterium]